MEGTMQGTIVERYTGRVISVPRGEGYAFIELNTIRSSNDSPHDLPTTENVYVHQDQCSAQLRVGMQLRFEVREDTRRNSAFRAYNVHEILEAEMIPAGQQIVPGFPLILRPGATGVVHYESVQHPAHNRAKQVDPETVAKVVENQPMPQIPRDMSEFPATDEQKMAFLRYLLFYLYPALKEFGTRFDILNPDDTQLDELVAQAKEGMLELGFEANDPAITDMEKQVKDFKGIREVLQIVWQEGLVRPDTIIPIERFPDHFMAVPVLFFYAVGDKKQEADRLWTAEDPQVHRASKWFCDLLPDNQRWADMFLTFNRRLRTLNRYSGDTIPPAIISRMRRCAKHFDHIVIATPYHDVAGADWQDEKWLRLIDPYVLAFKDGLPVYFVLGRFSDTGLFPLFNEMVADTMEYLKARKEALKVFNDKNEGGKMASFAYWYPREADHFLGDRLKQMVDDAHTAFEAGKLFDWLRNDWEVVDTDHQLTD